MKKISTGEIIVAKDVTIITKEIAGKIDKIRIYNGKKNEENTQLIIKTVEDEEIVNKEIGNKDWVLYPKRYGGGGQIPEEGRPEAPTIPPEASVGEKYSCVGVLTIDVMNAGLKGRIENIVITVE